MAKHNDKAFQDGLRMSFRQKLEEQLKHGLAQGMYAACKVMLDKASNEEKTPEERIEDIKAFCDTIVKVKASNGSPSTKAVE